MSALSTYSPPNGLRAWTVVLSSALFFFYIFIQMNMFNEMAPELMVYFNLSPQQLGNLSAMYFYGTVIFLFPAGILLDRFSVRILLLLATVLGVIATAIFSFTSHFWIAAIARFVVGMMASFAIVSCVKLASRWFTTQHMAVVMGLCVTIAMLGGVLAQAPFVWLMNTLGWQQTLLCNLGLGGVIFIWLFIFVRDYPHDYPVQLEQRVMGSEMRFWTAIRTVVKNKQNWFAGLYTCLINLPSMLTARVQGLSSVIIMAGGFMQPVFGWLIKTSQPLSQSKSHTGEAYQYVDFFWSMWLMPMAFILALIIAWCVKETYCQRL